MMMPGSMPAMRQHEHRLLRACDRANDVGGDDGFAAPGRRHKDDALASGGDRAVKLLDHVALVWAELGHAAPERDRGCRKPARAPLRIVAVTAGNPSSLTRPLEQQAAISRSSQLRGSSSPPATSWWSRKLARFSALFRPPGPTAASAAHSRWSAAAP